MARGRSTFAQIGLAFGIAISMCAPTMSQGPLEVDRSVDNLMVVLRESIGANKQDEKLVSMGPFRATVGGREIEVPIAAFAFIGDMHIRFVFDGERASLNATPDDLARLGLDAEAALAVAVANIKRVYGMPEIVPWTAGLMQVNGKAPDYDSSYFLDRDFWRALAKRHPDGIVVAVAKRGGLAFAPLMDAKAVDTLRRGIEYLHSSSGSLRVSGALYLYKDDRWTVFQPTQAKQR